VGGSGRGLIWSTVPVFAWRGWGMSLSVASSGPRLQPETTNMRRRSVNYSASTFVQWLINVVGQAENHYAVKMETVFFFETLVATSHGTHCNSECHSVILMKPSSSLCPECYAKIVPPVWYWMAKLVDGSGVADGRYLLQSSAMRLQILIHSECKSIKRPSQEVQSLPITHRWYCSVVPLFDHRTSWRSFEFVRPVIWSCTKLVHKRSVCLSVNNDRLH